MCLDMNGKRRLLPHLKLARRWARVEFGPFVVLFKHDDLDDLFGRANGLEFAFQRGIHEKAWNSRKRRGIHRDGVEFTKQRGIGRRVLGDVGRSVHTAGSLPPAATATLRAKKGYQLARDFPSSSTILHEHSYCISTNSG